jgi:hypothetical protein
MATKVFNVDALTKAPMRVVLLDGVEHEIVQMSVADYLATLDMAEELEKDNTVQSQIKGIVAIVARAIPTLTEERLLKIDFDTLTSIAAFVRGEIPEELASALEQDAVDESDTEKKA